MSGHQTQDTRKKQPEAVALDSLLYKMFVYSVKIKKRYIDRLMTSLEKKSDPGPSAQTQEQAWAVLQNPENSIDFAEYNNTQLMLKTNGATSSFLLRYLPSELIDDIASKLRLLPRSAILSLK